MTSYRFAPDRRGRFAARFMGKLSRELQKAFLEEKAERKMTQSKLAALLGVDRAVVSRQLNGHTNLTARTIADYAWALNRELVFSMPRRQVKAGANTIPPAQPIVSTPTQISPVGTAVATAAGPVGTDVLRSATEMLNPGLTAR